MVYSFSYCHFPFVGTIVCGKILYSNPAILLHDTFTKVIGASGLTSILLQMGILLLNTRVLKYIDPYCFFFV